MSMEAAKNSAPSGQPVGLGAPNPGDEEKVNATEDNPRPTRAKRKLIEVDPLYALLMNCVGMSELMLIIDSHQTNVVKELAQGAADNVQRQEVKIRNALNNLKGKTDEKERADANGELNTVQTEAQNKNQNWANVVQTGNTGMTGLQNSIANQLAVPQSAVDALGVFGNLLNGWSRSS